MKKFFLSFLVVILTILISLTVFVFAASKSVPEGTEEIIDEVLSSELPNLILGDSGKVVSNGIEIWYESIPPKTATKGHILLLMGLGGTALEWPNYFIEPLLDSGYHVIRIDNRGTGLSSWSLKNIKLDDMALDAVAVLDHLEIKSAHIIGMSMGGMIGQVMAVDYPQRVLTLTSYSSSAYINDPELPPLSQATVTSLIATGLRYQVNPIERNIIRAIISIRRLLAYELSFLRIKTLVEQTAFNLRFRRRFNPYAYIYQTRAIMQSGSRYEGLAQINIPTLVIHGMQDPLIPVPHGKKMAEIIPDAKLLLIEELGHDINPNHITDIHEAIFDLITL